MQELRTINKYKQHRKRTVILIAAGLLVLIAAFYGYSEYYRKPADIKKIKPQSGISAAELIKAFETDQQKANSLFPGKVIAVTGKIKSIEKNDNGFYTVILGEDASMSSVRCSMDSVYQQEIAGIATGTEIKIKGVCTGFNADELLGSDVMLNRCVVSK